MIGAGVFVALAPAAAAAGSGLLVGLAVAALVAYCNATSSARLAARYPQSGGTYVYGRERLGAFWGYLAGWGFVVGKTASCAAMALTVGYYVLPAYAHVIAVATVVGADGHQLPRRPEVRAHDAADRGRRAVGAGGRRRRRLRLGRSIFRARLQLGGQAGGVLQAAGLLFFAFAGYARIATLGEEVRDPSARFPSAIPLALGITLVVYAAVAVAALSVLGSDGLARATAPLAEAVRAAGMPGFEPVVRVGAALAAVGSLLALLLGVSRTTLAMARDRSPAATAIGCAPAVQGTPPGRTGRRCRGCGGGGVRRYSRRDRFLLVRGAGVLRGRRTRRRGRWGIGSSPRSA